MDEQHSKELGYNTVAIAVDKDKNSQQAVKWAIDHLLKGKAYPVVIIHVKTSHHSSSEPIPQNGRAPTESEMQQLFYLYRGFCARKGVDAEELVLQDSDVAGGLVRFINSRSIGSVVVGASSRNALMKRFKQADVPTSLGKYAPEFCAVYVISKGKIQSARPAKRPSLPSKPSTPQSTLSSSNTMSSKSSYWSSSSMSSSITSSSITCSSPSRSSTGTPRSKFKPKGALPGSDTPPRLSSCSEDNMSLNQSLCTDSPKSVSQTSLPPQPNSGSSIDDPTRNFSRESWSSEGRRAPPAEIRDWSNEGRRTPPRFPTKLAQLERPMQIDGSSFSSTSTVSTLSNSVMSIGSMGYPSIASTISIESSSSATFEDELEAEMKRLRDEIGKTMELYHSLNQQVTMAKQKAELLAQRRGEDLTIEEAKFVKEAVFYVAELEGQKCKAAMDAAEMSQNLVDIEAQKSKITGERNKRDEEKNKASSGIHYRIYTLEDIQSATNHFSNSLQIGEGGYGPVYRAKLHHTPVAIKVLRPDVSQGLSQFQQEIDVLGRIRHPNMVLLVGACPEYGCLVYEYMENGSLEDRLFRKNNTPPIPWRLRFRIASEIATALLFLHENKPESMVHRDLKPANILLDGNYTSKIGDVGLARLVPPTVANQITQYHMTAAAGTFCYIDPEYQQTGLLGTKSDVYSFGVLLLQLVTARPAMALAYHVEEAIEEGNFAKMLDPTIPDWPVPEALSLAQLALKCCELRKRDRPDLGSVVLPELVRLRDFAMNI